jgi:hypothetical protein
MAGVATLALSLPAGGQCCPISDAKRKVNFYKKLKTKRLILVQNKSTFWQWFLST